jgi:hypothetical protein
MEEKKQDALILFRNGDEVQFKDFATYQLGSGFFGIIDKVDGMSIYPSDLISSIHITEQE